MNYGENITGAFWTALRNPYLWIFGLFVGGSGSTVGLSNQNQDIGPNRDLLRFAEDNLVAIIIVSIVFVLSLVIISIALSVISQAGLVASVAALHEGRQSSFSETWRSGASRFWRMLGLQITLLLVWILLFVAAIIPAVLASLLILTLSEPGFISIALIVVISLLTLLLLILLFIPFSIIGALAARNLVLEDNQIFGSLGDGYNLFRANIGKSLLVWLIQIGIAVGVGLIVGIVTFAAGYPVSWLLAPLLSGFGVGDILLVAGALIVFSLPFLILGAAVSAFAHAYWTIAYLQLRGADDLNTTEDG